jgi:hypothetical protein
MIVTFDPRFQPWLAASDDDTRPVLRAVNVDPEGYLVATNTHILVVVPCEIENAPSDFTGCSIPSEWLSAISRFKPKKSTSFTLDIDLADNTVSAFTRIGDVRTSLVGSDRNTFPRWRRVLPASLHGEQSSIARSVNPRYVAIISQALGLGDKFPFISPTVDGPMVVTGENGSFAVVMPRTDSGQAKRIEATALLFGKLRGETPKPASVTPPVENREAVAA